jgi:hypothetical protein
MRSAYPPRQLETLTSNKVLKKAPSFPRRRESNPLNLAAMNFQVVDL